MNTDFADFYGLAQIFFRHEKAQNAQKITKRAKKAFYKSINNWIAHRVRNDRCGFDSIRGQIPRLRPRAFWRKHGGCAWDDNGVWNGDKCSISTVGRDSHRTVSRRPVWAGVSKDNANRR